MAWLHRFFHHILPDFSKPTAHSASSTRYTGIPDFTRDGPDPFTISEALLELFSSGTWDQKYRALKRWQRVLLTENTIAALVQMALDARRSDPLEASFFFLFAELIENARCVGIKAAWRSFLPKVTGGYNLQLADTLLIETQRTWVLKAAEGDLRAQRRFLEKHLELLSYGSLALLQLTLISIQQKSETEFGLLQSATSNKLWNLLFDIRKRGGDAQAIRDAYVNWCGGFVLDIPEWLNSAFERSLALCHLGPHHLTARQRIALWEEAIERTRREPENVAAETWAEMHVMEQHAYNDARCRDKPQLQQRELANLSFALTIYTESRYPYAWALNQNALGSLYHDYLQGNQSDNIEQAIACFQAALRVFTEQDFPREWAETQNYLGLVYRDRLQGNKEENQEKAILCHKAALRAFTERDTPRDWAMVQANLGALHLERLHGRKAANQSLAIGYFREALHVYTEREFPVEWATTQNNLGNVLAAFLLDNPINNRQQAISCYQAALRIRTEREFPVEWATT